MITKFDYTEGLNLLKQQRENLGTITENLYHAQVQVKPTEEYLETHMTNYFFQLHSFEILINGSKVFPNTDKKFIDLSSVSILTRALIENYFSMHYLYFEPMDNFDLAKFRCLLYNIHGLNIRQEMQIEMPPNPADREKLVKEKEMMDLYTNELMANKVFKDLRPEKQKQLLKKNPARDLSLTQLVSKPYFTSQQFRQTWEYLCNYAHSECVSAMQLKTIYTNPQIFDATPSLVRQPLFSVIMMNSSLFTYLNKRFKASEIIYNGFTETFKKSNEFWFQVSQDE